MSLFGLCCAGVCGMLRAVFGCVFGASGGSLFFFVKYNSGSVITSLGFGFSVLFLEDGAVARSRQCLRSRS